MNHKEEMQHLKKHDPIQYYELTSNPTGGDNSTSFTGGFVCLVIIGLVATLLFCF
jgi:hypothetical protein